LEFLRVASRATSVYTCRAFRGMGDDIPLDSKFEEGIMCLLKEYRKIIANPLSDTPLRVRKVLADLDFIELFEWTFRFVLPTMCRYRSNATLHYFVFRWILRAAIDSDVSGTSIVKVALGKVFNLDVVLQRPSQVPSNNAFALHIAVGNGDWNDDEEEPLYF
jgi:hypothetical protein